MGLGRHILAGAIAASVAACAPVVDRSDVLGPITVASVSVDASTAVVEGRDLPITRAAAAGLLEDAIEGAVARSNDPNGRAVNVDVVMTQIRLAPPLERVVAGTSSATGTLTVTDAETGERLKAPVSVTGNTTNLRAPGVVGLATTVTPEEDNRGTVRGFAEAIRQTLFGSET